MGNSVVRNIFVSQGSIFPFVYIIKRPPSHPILPTWMIFTTILLFPILRRRFLQHLFCHYQLHRYFDRTLSNSISNTCTYIAVVLVWSLSTLFATAPWNHPLRFSSVTRIHRFLQDVTILLPCLCLTTLTLVTSIFIATPCSVLFTCANSDA